MQLEFEWCDPDPEPASSGVAYVPQMAVRSRPGAVPCNIEGGCEYGCVAARDSTARGGSLLHGGLCQRHVKEKACGYRACGSGRGCGNLATYGISEFRVSRDPSALLCFACMMHKRNVARRVELDGKLCECGRLVSVLCPDGLFCDKCYAALRNGGALCSFEGCGETQEKIGLCNGHFMQHYRGVGLTPFGTTGGGFSAADERGGWLYIVLAEGDGVPMFHGFGISNSMGQRERVHRNEVPGIEFLYRFWWADASVAADIERDWKARLAVFNSARPGAFKTEAFPVDVAAVYGMLADVAERLPDKTIEGDSDE
jgi:hypothetical protein